MVKEALIGIAGAATLGGALALAAIDDYKGYTYVSSYQYRIADEQPQYESATSSYKGPAPRMFKDDDGNGIVSVSIFVDEAGEKLEVQISDDRYAEMGRAGGFERVPAKEEIPFLLAL